VILEGIDAQAMDSAELEKVTGAHVEVQLGNGSTISLNDSASSALISITIAPHACIKVGASGFVSGHC
jgi:hypothetical protein